MKPTGQHYLQQYPVHLQESFSVTIWIQETRLLDNGEFEEVVTLPFTVVRQVVREVDGCWRVFC